MISRLQSIPGRRAMGITLVLLIGFSIVSPLPGQTPGGILKINVLQGEGSLNNIRRKLAQAPVVEIRDESGRAMEGASVTFTLPFDGPGGKFANGERNFTVTTDAQGRAACAPFIPNETEGRFNINVSATHKERKGTVVIPQSNTLAGGLSDGKSGGRRPPRWLLGLGLTGGTTAALILAKRGGGSNGPSTTPVPPTTISVGSVTVGGPR